MKKYTYKRVKIVYSLGFDIKGGGWKETSQSERMNVVAKELNRLGEEGWRLLPPLIMNDYVDEEHSAAVGLLIREISE